MTQSCRGAVGLFVVLLTVLAGRAAAAGPATRPFPDPPPWVADQTLYELNLRQFSPAGDVAGFRRQLPRLKALGVGTIWVMPVNPIGVEHRAGNPGSLGSPYASRDYLAFNPEFGTVEQFKAAVAEAHAMGLHVILDWVALHTAPDHVWVAQHPDWYKHDAAGHMVHPDPTWLDVVALNYDVPAVHKAMIDAMTYWVRDVGVDGFRCDTAEWVPLDFWCEARDALRKVKPIFLLAEGGDPRLLAYAFDAEYAWSLQGNMVEIVKGTKTATDLANYLTADARLMPPGRFRLNFTTNHDKNAWEGTTREQLGDGVEAFTVLTFTVPGMPLIFNGQEAGAEHRLAFFDHDPIVWRDDPAAARYAALAKLKRENPALRDGPGAAPLRLLHVSDAPTVLAFARPAAGGRVVVVANLGDHPAHLTVPDEAVGLNATLGGEPPPPKGSGLDLPPWAYRVWSSGPGR